MKKQARTILEDELDKLYNQRKNKVDQISDRREVYSISESLVEDLVDLNIKIKYLEDFLNE